MYGIYAVSVAHCVRGGCEYKPFKGCFYFINATELYFNNGNNEIEVQTDRQLIDKFRGSFFTRK